MFWGMTGLSTPSPVDTILDKENYTLEELLDEDEIIQECKALNTRLINFLHERPQVEQLLHYIVEEAPDDAGKKRTFNFPFIACEIFTCDVDVILRTLVEDEELMNFLFSFLKPDHPHSTLLAGYFSKVVVCLMLRKTAPLMNYVQAHQEIFHQLVDLIGITSIMEVLIRLIGADESMYSNYVDAMQWLDDANVLDLIVDKFSSSDSPEVHANAAEVLCAITRYAPPGLAAKISRPSFVGRLFRHGLEDSRPKSVLVNCLSVCISLLDPKRIASASLNSFVNQLNHGSVVTPNREMVEGMLGCLGDLLKLLDVSSTESILPTTYGNLKPPVGKHRMKIVEFMSVLLSIGSEPAEKELIQLGAIQRVLYFFFEYPYNNFLHHHVENIVVSCLESKGSLLVGHLLNDCGIVSKMLSAEKQPTLSADTSKLTLAAEGKSPPRIGNVGHMTRISNKLIQLSNSNSTIQTHLQENEEWTDWRTNVLVKRNAVENVYYWACGRPTALQDHGRNSDDEVFRNRDYDVAALTNNVSQAFRYGISSHDEIDEPHGLEQDDEDVYFGDETADVVISSLRLGDDQDSSSLFTKSNWFAFEEDIGVNDRSIDSLPASPPNSDETDKVRKNDELNGSDQGTDKGLVSGQVIGNGPIEEDPADSEHPTGMEGDESPGSVEWRDSTDTSDLPEASRTPDVPNGELELGKDDHADSITSTSGQGLGSNNREDEGSADYSSINNDKPGLLDDKGSARSTDESEVKQENIEREKVAMECEVK